MYTLITLLYSFRLFVEKLRKDPEYCNTLSKGTRPKISKVDLPCLVVDVNLQSHRELHKEKSQILNLGGKEGDANFASQYRRKGWKQMGFKPYIR